MNLAPENASKSVLIVEMDGQEDIFFGAEEDFRRRFDNRLHDVHRQTDRQTDMKTRGPYQQAEGAPSQGLRNVCVLYIDRQTERQTDRQTERQTDRHTDRQTDRQTWRQPC